jgi:hypothetical protein
MKRRKRRARRRKPEEQHQEQQQQQQGRWVIARYGEDGSVQYWSENNTWLRYEDGQPAGPFDSYPIAVYEAEPDTLTVTGMANAHAVPVPDET